MSNKLIFANTGPQLSHIIKDHPKETAIPEAVRNMFEASTAYYAVYKPNQSIELKIRKLDIEPGLLEYETSNGKIIDRFKNKLSFLNPGGMTASELTTAFCKIGSSVGKQNSFETNFGQGIRTSTLYWTDLGCITYKPNHGAHFVWLGKKNKGGNDFDIDIKSANGSDLVYNVTDWVIKNASDREYNLDEEFTEVIFLGKDADPTQDTFVDPYGTGKEQSVLWIRKAIYARFWGIPKNVKLLLHASILSKDTAKKSSGYREFMTFEECLSWDLPKVKEKPKSQIVKTQSGVRIHYFYDSPLGENYKNPNSPYSTFKSNDNGWGGGNISGIILKNEIYDVKSHDGNETSSFIKLGIQQDFRHFKIMYELPQDAGYTYDMYRTVILNGQDPILFDNENVLQDIVDNMPEWFSDLVAKTKMKSKTNLNEEIKNRLAAQKSLFNPFAGLTTNGNGSVIGQYQPSPKPRVPLNQNIPRKPGSRNKAFGEPILPEIIPNPSVTEPFFAKVEGTRDHPCVFTNPEWKQLENLATQLDFDRSKGRWYFRAKELLENEFTICSVIWYLNALSENIHGNISTEEYQDTIAPKSINMYLMAIQTSIFNDVKKTLYSEYLLDSKEIKTREADSYANDSIEEKQARWSERASVTLPSFAE